MQRPVADHRSEIERLLVALGRPAERRQLVARDLHAPPDDDLVVIEEGQAPELRQACKEGRLICPIRDCPHPALTTAGQSKRDHFRHLTTGGAGHGPERLAHQHGKAVLIKWLRRRHPRLEVALEARVETGQVADVLVRSPQSGRRVALEMQCSPLDPAAWVARQDGYASAGIACQWLFWSQPPWLRRPRGEQHERLDLAQRPPLLDAVEERGLAWVWFDPDALVLAAAVSDQEWATTHWHGNQVQVVPFALDACRLDATGIRHPQLDELLTARAAAFERRQREEEIRAKVAAATRREWAEAKAAWEEPEASQLLALTADIPDGGEVFAGLCDGQIREAVVRSLPPVGTSLTITRLQWLDAQAATRLGRSRLPEDWPMQKLVALLVQHGYVSSYDLPVVRANLQLSPAAAQAEEQRRQAEREAARRRTAARVAEQANKLGADYSGSFLDLLGALKRGDITVEEFERRRAEMGPRPGA